MTRLIKYCVVSLGYLSTSTSPRFGVWNRYDNSSIIRYWPFWKFGSIEEPETINGWKTKYRIGKIMISATNMTFTKSHKNNRPAVNPPLEAGLDASGLVFSSISI